MRDTFFKMCTLTEVLKGSMYVKFVKPSCFLLPVSMYARPQNSEKRNVTDDPSETFLSKNYCFSSIKT